MNSTRGHLADLEELERTLADMLTACVVGDRQGLTTGIAKGGSWRVRS